MLLKRVVLVSLAFAVLTADIFAKSEKKPLKFTSPLDVKFIKSNSFHTLSNDEWNEENFDKAAKIYSKTEDVRIVGEPQLKQDIVAPVTNCLLCLDGTGGSVGLSGSFSVGTSTGISLDLVDPILGVLNAGTSFSVSPSFSQSMGFSCSASEKGVAQLQLRPFYVSFQYKTKQSYFNSLSNEVVEQSAWSDVQNGAMPAMMTPAIKCVNASSAICGMPPRKFPLPA